LPIPILLLILLILLLIFLRAGAEGNVWGAFRSIQALVGPIIFLGIVALWAAPPSRRVMSCVALYFILVAMLEWFFPDIYRVIASDLLTRASVSDGHRGVSLLTTEPTYAAISILYFLFLAIWSGEYWGYSHRWIEPVLAICMMATGSTYLILFLLALAFLRWPLVTGMAVTTLLVFISIFGVYALDNDQSVRLIVAASRVLAVDLDNILSSISMLDSSIGSRLVTNVASYITPFHSPFGMGLNCESLPNALYAARFDFAYDNPVISFAMYNGCLKPQSYFAAITLGFGMFSVIFFFLILLTCRHIARLSKQKIWSSAFVVAVIVLAVQGQITNPIPWIMLFIAFNLKYRNLVQHRGQCSGLIKPDTI